MDPRFEITYARPEDAEELLAVKDACWREAYAHLLSPEFLAGLGADPGRTERWRGGLAHDGGARHALARIGGRVVGLAGGGPALEEHPPTETALYTAYVLAEAHGTGVAQALVEAVIGDRPAYLWVFEDNPRARAFYAKLGFVPDGARQLDEIDGRQIPEIRMVRP